MLVSLIPHTTSGNYSAALGMTHSTLPKIANNHILKIIFFIYIIYIWCIHSTVQKFEMKPFNKQ